MIRRPHLGECEEDLLKQEEEFLKASGKEPKWKRNSEDVEQKEKKHKSLPLMGDIVEKNQERLGYAVEILKTDDGFPQPFKVDLGAPRKREKKSLFALHMENSKQSANPMEVENATGSSFPTEIIQKEGRSCVLTGEGADQIHQENLNTLSKMSEAYILAEQKKLQETLDPGLIEFLKSRRKKQVVKVKVEEIKMECTDTPVENVREKVVKYVDEKWADMDFLEKEKLEWIGDIPDAKALEPDQPYSARFDFNGDLQPFKTEIDVTKSLHHHGDEPDRPGYTIQELYQLSRSTVLQQRILALNTIANIIRKTKLGYYDKCFEGFLLHKLIESDLFFLLRFSIDENSLIPASLKCLRELLYNETDELCLDKLLGVTDSDEQPLLFNKMETNQDEEKELKDHVVISCDLIKGVLRTDLLFRLSYILTHLTPSRESAIHIIESLIRIARHSQEAAEEVVTTPQLLNSVYLYIKSAQPVHQGVKLFRVLVTHAKIIGVKILKTFPMDFLLDFVNVEEIDEMLNSELYHLKLESVYLWRCFLHYELMIDDFASFAPCFIRLLRFFQEKVDVGQGDFDFELFSAISSLCIVCVNNKVPIDSNFHVLMKICLEKWLKQITRLNFCDFSSCKAIGCALRFFIADFRINGVNESSLNFVKHIDSVLISFINSDTFDIISLNLIKYSYIFSVTEVLRDPKNLPSLCSIYHGGVDYLKIIHMHSPLPLFLSLSEYLLATYKICNDLKPTINLFLDHENVKKYLRGLDQINPRPAWFALFEKSYLVNLLYLTMNKNSSDCLPIAFRLLPIMRADDEDAKKIISLVSSASTKSLPKTSNMTLVYKSDLISEDWMYKLIYIRGGNKKEVVRPIQFISFILENKPELLEKVPHTNRYFHLCTVFLTDVNVFDPEVHQYLEINFKDIINNREKIDLNVKVAESKSFYDLYTELITQYAGWSYGLKIFAEFVMFPLQNKFDVSFRRLIWSEYLHVLKVVTLPFPLDDFVPLTEFTEPCETDETLLVIYLNAVSCNMILKLRNPFVYNLALGNVRNYIRSDCVNDKFLSFLMKKINSLKDEGLKNELLN